MLTRFVRTQLAIFTVAGVIGLLTMALAYVQVPTLMGIGRMTVTLNLPRGGGLYHFSNVTYRGIQIGKVTALAATVEGARATLSLDNAARIPADLQAEVHSMSAIGEQYVDLVPRRSEGPYLHDGSVIAAANATVPPQVGPMLNQLSALIKSVPAERVSGLLDESFKAFDGAGYDLGSLFDSTSKLANDFKHVAPQSRSLIDRSAPLLDGQATSTASIQTWTRSLAGITDQVVTDDPKLRALLRDGPGFADEVSRLLTQVRPTLPLLLANLTSLGQVGLTYLPSLEQLLVLLPPLTGAFQAQQPSKNPTGLPVGDFRISLEDPTGCTVGFLPPSQWRSPADTTTIDTPDGLYCKLPQDSPIGVRGARNYPCMAKPGKRAPTVEMCDSDKPFEPLALRQHTLGPAPLDPNLLSQGAAPDDRIDSSHIFGPIDGTPPAAPAPPASPGPPLEPGAPDLHPAHEPSAMPPAGFAPPAQIRNPADSNNISRSSVASATYDPGTGLVVASDGETLRQTDLTAAGRPTSWKDMLLPDQKLPS